MTNTHRTQITNTSSQYMLVGNSSEVILTGTKVQCEQALGGISIDESKWASVTILAPGETSESNLVSYDGPSLKNNGPVDFAGLCEPE